MIYTPPLIVSIGLIILTAVILIAATGFIILPLWWSYSSHKNNKWIKSKIKDGVPTKWGWVVRHPENLHLGNYVDIGFGTYIQAENRIEIGNNVQIGAHCAIYSRNTIDGTASKIIIEDNVKIGAGTIILPNSTGYPLYICHDSKIGALSLVKQHVPSNSLYCGVPAKEKVLWEDTQVFDTKDGTIKKVKELK